MNTQGRSWGLAGVVVAAALAVVGCGEDEAGPGTPDQAAPSRPSGLVASGLATTPGAAAAVTLNWTANAESDVATYQVYFSTTPANETSYELLGTVPATVQTYQDARALGSAYAYKVTAMDTAENESERSDAAIVELPNWPTGGTKVSTSDWRDEDF